MENIVILCVGSSKNICDSFGPKVGELLKLTNMPCYIYGKIDKNINAKNINSTINFLKKYHPDFKIIVVDCRLSLKNTIKLCFGIGNLTVAYFSKKVSVGDCYFTLDIPITKMKKIKQTEIDKFSYICSKLIQNFINNKKYKLYLKNN